MRTPIPSDMTDSMTESVFTCSGELFPWAEKVSTQVFTNPITAWPLPGLSGIPLVSWNAHCKAEEAKMVLCLFSGAPKNCNRSPYRGTFIFMKLFY